MFDVSKGVSTGVASTSIGISSKDMQIGSSGGGDCVRLGGFAFVSSRHLATLSCTNAGSLSGIRGRISSCSSDWLVGTSSSGSYAELEVNGVKSDTGEDSRSFFGGEGLAESGCCESSAN